MKMKIERYRHYSIWFGFMDTFLQTVSKQISYGDAKIEILHISDKLSKHYQVVIGFSGSYVCEEMTIDRCAEELASLEPKDSLQP